MMEPDSPDRNSIAHHVFSNSTTMIGVCITVIALFNVMKTGIRTYADEILSINALFFIVASLFSYLSLRNGSSLCETIVDIFFFLGMVLMVFAGLMIVFVNY